MSTLVGLFASLGAAIIRSEKTGISNSFAHLQGAPRSMDIYLPIAEMAVNVFVIPAWEASWAFSLVCSASAAA